MTATRDGDFRAIQPKELYRTQQYGTAVYRSKLAWRVRELGYELQVGNGAPEIKGYSREYLEANSPRSQLIQEHLKEAGLSGAAAAQIAAHRTREAKLPVDRGEVKAQHRTVAEAQLYMVDESSLVSTRQTGEFLDRLGPNDRVILVGDTRQHQSVDAGRPFEQLQDAGMRTAKLDEIVRQKDPGLRQVVDHLAHGRVREAVSELQNQGRVHEIPDRTQRFDAIARDYADSSGRTLVAAPDNQSRRELNDHITRELKDRGVVGREDHQAAVLVPRQDMTGADLAWAAHYREGDVIGTRKAVAMLASSRASTRRFVRLMLDKITLKVEFRDQSTKGVRPSSTSGRRRLRKSRT